jgi:hypothetical protein
LVGIWREEGLDMAQGFRARPLGLPCFCDGIFQGFAWKELSEVRSEELPKSPGVYVLRLVDEGDVDGAIDFLRDIVDRVGWSELRGFVSARLKRLERLKGRLESRGCPVIYIGSSKSLANRCAELAGRRHTALLPVMALLVSGATIGFGFRAMANVGEAKDLERELKKRYGEVHDVMPPLVER